MRKYYIVAMKKVLEVILEYLNDFLDMIYPRVCLNCDTILVYQEEHICIGCKFSLPKTNYHIKSENRLEQKFVFEPKVKAVAAYLYYNKKGVAQKLITEMKYRGVTEIGPLLGRWYSNDLKKVKWPVEMIVPVPLHHSKLSKRGFNQSELFAQGLSDGLDIPVISDAVLRVKKTNTQTQKNKVERWQNMDGVYELSDPAIFKDKHVMVVDDVLTTGATMGELVTLIAKAGAEGIYIACLAAGK